MSQGQSPDAPANRPHDGAGGSPLTIPAHWFDGVAISLSAVCVVHCLALPLIIALLPALSQWLHLPEAIHAWLLACAIPVSMLVLGKSAHRHRAARGTLLLGIAGLALMGGALMAPTETLETVITVSGAALLASAHVQNWRRRARCAAPA
ncbi:MerC domain-containing protein [Aurantiacibacter xanthus]|uniref:MerC domain-containing protein n=1 Tax=Aurantiacibacter xanthus TaxID=1784712 RepID=A0A3A1P5U3_9SPHN|nr:MerC domain-containing protein [Aurantiacibacter xanthus]RIV85516.1 MerC domain-containing protein [Aurantiacibacter xanthus]